MTTSEYAQDLYDTFFKKDIIDLVKEKKDTSKSKKSQNKDNTEKYIDEYKELKSKHRKKIVEKMSDDDPD